QRGQRSLGKHGFVELPPGGHRVRSKLTAFGSHFAVHFWKHVVTPSGVFSPRFHATPGGRFRPTTLVTFPWLEAVADLPAANGKVFPLSKTFPDFPARRRKSLIIDCNSSCPFLLPATLRSAVPSPTSW